MTDAFAVALSRLSRVPGVRAAFIVEADAGVPVVADVSADVDGTAVAALAAALFQRTSQASELVGLGGLETFQLQALGGHLLIAGAGDLAVAVLLESNAQLGMVRMEARRAVDAVRALTGEPAAEVDGA
jgi:predicted regulator of Ras-like GTPase activity (Roadblock/LC7/MglB family)